MGAGADLEPSVSVVIPAFNAERTLAAVLMSLEAQVPAPDEIIVVDDRSADRTAEIARELGATVIEPERRGFAGGARNRGWDAARGDVVVFLDSDAIPEPDWGAALQRGLREFPGAIVGGARTFSARTPWGWVSHLQVETPYLPRGAPRRVPFVSSLCMAVPRSLALRWDESYGGEDAIFCADALAAGVPLVFDPRIRAFHDHGRETFDELRRQQARLAYGLARCGRIQQEGAHKRIFSRVPLHYFGLIRLVFIYRRVRENRELRTRFLQVLPRMAFAEWTLGLTSLRYVVHRPELRAPERRERS